LFWTIFIIIAYIFNSFKVYCKQSFKVSLVNGASCNFGRIFTLHLGIRWVNCFWIVLYAKKWTLYDTISVMSYADFTICWACCLMGLFNCLVLGNQLKFLNFYHEIAKLWKVVHSLKNTHMTLTFKPKHINHLKKCH
jgi:hypothetical protein